MDTLCPPFVLYSQVAVSAGCDVLTKYSAVSRKVVMQTKSRVSSLTFSACEDEIHGYTWERRYMHLAVSTDKSKKMGNTVGQGKAKRVVMVRLNEI